MMKVTLQVLFQEFAYNLYLHQVSQWPGKFFKCYPG